MDLKLVCISCRKTYELTELRYHCDCGALLEVQQPLSALKGRLTAQDFDTKGFAADGPAKSGVWRYRRLIMPLEDEAIVSRGEGNTMLYRSPRVSEYAGVDEVLLKHEGENPTGSFKDRGMTVGVTFARRLGMKAVVCASTGNTSASMAAYAALAGMRAIVLIPEGNIAFGKLSQALAYGAETLQIKGNFDAAMQMVSELAQEKIFYLLNSLNPFRLEGQKSIVFEMLQQLAWQAPDWLVLPGGNLGNVSAFGKALRELLKLGLISAAPRIAVIQAKGANPLYQSYLTGFETYTAVAQPETVCTAIRIGNPVNIAKAIQVLQEFNGVVYQVDDEEALDAKAVIDAAGIGAEPSSCVTLAGIRGLAKQGVIRKHERVVGVLTGHILKDPVTTTNYHTRQIKDMACRYANQPQVIEARMSELHRFLNREEP